MENRVSLKRRALLWRMAAIAAGVGVAQPGTAAPSKADPARWRPQTGDILVHGLGPDEGLPITADAVELESSPVVAFPQDPGSGLIRSRSRFNKVLIMRLQTAALDHRTAPHAAEGIAVYSAICTHEACDVSAWLEQQKQLLCECHLSRFNPYKFGKVGGGPATRKLPMLPIRVEQGRIVVAGPFSKRPGPARR